MARGRPTLYVVCLILFAVAFVAFVLGFSFPAWQVVDLGQYEQNVGLWQICKVTVDSCERLDYDSGGDWLIAVRSLEIFALIMFVFTAVALLYENWYQRFGLRSLLERSFAPIVCLLAGLAGLIGLVVFVAEVEDQPGDPEYGWSLALLGGGSALAVVLAIGFCASASYLERRHRKGGSYYHDHKPTANGEAPYLTSNEYNYELPDYTDRTGALDSRGRPLVGGGDHLPGYALYDGSFNLPGDRRSLPPLGPPPPNQYYVMERAGGKPPLPALLPKSPQYYSYQEDRGDYRRGPRDNPAYDLSEGFPARPRSDDGPVYYVRESRLDDPYSRVHRGPPPRVGYNDPYGFDRLQGRGGGGGDGGYGAYGGRAMQEGPYRY